MRILVVGQDNTRRSPMLLALLKGRLWAKGLWREVKVISAGVNLVAANALTAAPEAIDAVGRRGLCLHHHRSCHVAKHTIGNLARFNFIICMSDDISDEIRARLAVTPCSLLVITVNDVPNLQDQRLNSFLECADKLDEFAEGFVEQLDTIISLGKPAKKVRA